MLRQPSHLLRLPAEIRNKIYEEVFHGARFEIVGKDDETQSSGPGILRSCRQVYIEALETYYRRSVFWIYLPASSVKGKITATRPSQLISWLERMHSQSRDLVTEIRCVVDVRGEDSDEAYYELMMWMLNNTRELLVRARLDEKVELVAMGYYTGRREAAWVGVDPKTLLGKIGSWTVVSGPVTSRHVIRRSCCQKLSG